MTMMTMTMLLLMRNVISHRATPAIWHRRPPPSPALKPQPSENIIVNHYQPPSNYQPLSTSKPRPKNLNHRKISSSTIINRHQDQSSSLSSLGINISNQAWLKKLEARKTCICHFSCPCVPCERLYHIIIK